MLNPVTQSLMQAAVAYASASYSSDRMKGALAFHHRLTSSTAYLVYGEAFDVLVFRGSQEPPDWVINLLTIPPVWYGGSWCHMGFALAHRALWSQVKHYVKASRPLLITGHSLGGAMADKTCDFLKDYPGEAHMITFGKPNVHLKLTAPRRTHLKTNLSVVAGSDIVARIPRFLYGPDPGQDLLYFATDGTTHLNPTGDFLRNDFRRWNLFSDHRVDKVYAVRVQQFLHAPTTQPHEV